jgi:hypothetical protein
MGQRPVGKPPFRVITNYFTRMFRKASTAPLDLKSKEAWAQRTTGRALVQLQAAQTSGQRIIWPPRRSKGKCQPNVVVQSMVVWAPMT